MNKFIGIGRLTADPEVTYMQNQDNTAVARYSLAIDRRIKKENEQTADFLRCVTFGKNAEFAEKYLRKGTKIAVVGRVQTGSYTDKHGNKVYTTDIVIEEQEFAESKNAGGNTAPSRPEPSAAGNGFMNIPDGIDEELPFN